MQADDLHVDLDRLWSKIRAASAPQAIPIPGEGECAGSPNTASELDPLQAQAAGHFRGPLRVLAPAGSGKTRTLTARITGLQARGVPANRILALAFNTRAAEELHERLVAARAGDVEARTFHSLGYEIVRDAYGWQYESGSERAAADLAGLILKDALPLPGHPGQAARRLQAARELFQLAKSRLLNFDEIGLPVEESFHPLAGPFRALVGEQQSAGLVTFTDMIYFALRALVDDGPLRERWQERFDFLLVDEFQDLNAAQMLLLRILALPQENVFAVGDDDQLIYAWRGADERQLLDFDRLYPGAGSVVLATNYRSGRRIVRHGRWLIEHNPDRVAKDIRPWAGAPPGTVTIEVHDTLDGQAAAAVEWLQRQKAHGRNWGDFGLLARTNADLDRMARALAEAEIPFQAANDGEDEGVSDADRPEPSKVTLLTVHRAKGKEFRNVVYFNLSRRAGSGRSEADERRVAYVGVTRAQEALLITADRERPSPFLREFALNPAFGDFAEPYLERRLTLTRRRLAWQRGDLRGWLRTITSSFVSGRPGEEGTDDEEIDQLETELRFRAALGISLKA